MRFKTTLLSLALCGLPAGLALADLEWITGGVPKNAPQTETSVAVPDAPAPESKAAPAGNQDIVLCHLTTCTKISFHYPFDSQNFFFLDKHNQVAYFAYFLLKPSSRIHTAVVEWYSPSDKLIAKTEKEFKVGFTDNLLAIGPDTWQYFLVETVLGMDRLHAESGQTSLPRDVGRYTVHLSVDGQLAGVTFFWVKERESGVSSVTPVAAPPKAPSEFPVFTPTSKGPIRRSVTPVPLNLTPVPQAVP